MSAGEGAAGDDARGLLAAADAWLEQDPDPETRAELAALRDAAASGDESALRDLESRFAARLTFGTAGLRGELGAGPQRMNRVLVAQAAAGLASWLLARETEPSIVIGYDARTNSEIFARDTAELMSGARVRAVLLPRPLPTPVLAFGVRHLGVSAGVMVTASHNPPRDNGYKVFLGGEHGGCQIVPPVDAEIEQRIREQAAGDIRALPRRDDYAVADESLLDEYVARTAALAPAPAAPVRFAYTAMHGVGWETARRVFDAAGYRDAAPVAEQIAPDPAFPTVAFPNPEEPGAMDLVLATGRDAGADVALANDPDADRLGVAVPDGRGWRTLTGNELGLLLGWRAAERTPPGGVLASSLVSSPALGAVAAAHGLRHVETLTGFKWIARVPGIAFGYEEALGYLVDPAKVRDKDGISAALDVLALVSELKAEGRTLDDRLLEAAERFGAFASGQVSVRVREPEELSRLMQRLRTRMPAEIAGRAVEGVDDFAAGVAGFPPSDILRIRLAGGARVIVRPSGTEPKLKAYLDAAWAQGPVRERLAAAQGVVAELEAGVRELVAG